MTLEQLAIPKSVIIDIGSKLFCFESLQFFNVNSRKLDRHIVRNCPFPLEIVYMDIGVLESISYMVPVGEFLQSSFLKMTGFLMGVSVTLMTSF